jgi:hypothetical protein
MQTGALMACCLVAMATYSIGQACWQRPPAARERLAVAALTLHEDKRFKDVQ